jgi:hypothetical protein
MADIIALMHCDENRIFQGNPDPMKLRVGERE